MKRDPWYYRMRALGRFIVVPVVIGVLLTMVAIQWLFDAIGVGQYAGPVIFALILAILGYWVWYRFIRPKTRKK